MTLSALVLSLADNKRMLGFRYAEWATSAPSLEADIAAAAMGLDDLGHSSVLYGCLEPLGDDPRGAARETDPASYLNLPYFDNPWSGWSQFVAANSILDTTFTLMLQAMVDGNVEVLRSRLRKMLQEERYHYLHGRSWLREGIDPEPLSEAWRQAIEWIGPDDGETAAMHREGALSMSPDQMRTLLSERLDLQLPDPDIDWSTWDAVRRRSQPGGIDEHTFGMLRGLEERRFMPAAAGARSSA